MFCGEELHMQLILWSLLLSLGRKAIPLSMVILISWDSNHPSIKPDTLPRPLPQMCRCCQTTDFFLHPARFPLGGSVRNGKNSRPGDESHPRILAGWLPVTYINVRIDCLAKFIYWAGVMPIWRTPMTATISTITIAGERSNPVVSFSGLRIYIITVTRK